VAIKYEYGNEHAIQRTIGSITIGAVKYDIDWMFHQDDVGKIISAEPCAYIFVGDVEVGNVHPSTWFLHGWESKADVIVDAASVIRSRKFYPGVRNMIDTLGV